jgi:Tol biopolymer transport system component
VSVQGGAPVPLCEVMNPRGLSWDADGSIVVAADRVGGLSRCPANGGALVPLTTPESGETSHRFPQVLPTAKAVLFTLAPGRGDTPDTNSIVMQRLDTGERKTLWKGGTFGRYLPSGHLVFVSQNTLFAAPLDLTRMEIVGTPRPVAQGVGTSVVSDSAFFDVSQTGLLAFAHESAGDRLPSLFRLDTSGMRHPLVPGELPLGMFQFSPDGRRGVFSVRAQGLWSYDVERQTRSRLTTEGSGALAWSRDGRYVFFRTRGTRRDGISVVRADGTGNPISLIDQRDAVAGLAVSPDGTHLAFDEVAGGGRGDADLWTLPIDLTGDTPRATGEPKVWLSTPSTEAGPRFSPDGRWVAYSSDETGRPELFVRPFAGAGGKVQISGDGLAGNFGWSPDGREVIYANRERQIIAVASTVSGQTFMPGASRHVTAMGPQDKLEDMAPDGKSFVISTASDVAASVRVTFVVNFFDEIRRRLAAAPTEP